MKIKVKQKYNKLALNDYDESSNRYFATRRSEEILKHIAPKILEVGAGTGLITSEILNKDHDLVAMDMSENMLKVLVKKTSFTKVVVGDAEHLPFKKNVFQTVVSSEMIYYLDNHALFFNDAHRVLKEHGSIVISAFSSLWSPLQKIRIILEKINIIKVGICDSFIVGSNRNFVRKKLLEADFKEVRVCGKIMLPFKYFHRMNLFLEKTVLEKIGLFFIATGKKN